MLAAGHRLRDSDAFRRTVRSGRRAGGAALVVHVLLRDPVSTDETDPTTDPTPPRVGFVVSKAVGNSVVRNRVKRRLRHLVRDVLADVPPGAEVVVRALPPAATSTVAELAAELTRCLQRACRPAGAGPTRRLVRGAAS